MTRDRWSKLPIFVAVQIKSVKMTVMPTFLYVFQMVAIFLPKSFFTQIYHLIIMSFIWNKKSAHIRKAIWSRNPRFHFLQSHFYQHIKILEHTRNSIRIWGQFRKHFNLKNICGFSQVMFNYFPLRPSWIRHLQLGTETVWSTFKNVLTIALHHSPFYVKTTIRQNWD